MAARSRLVSSVLGARQAGATVLAFKAAVDELSRLATARAQDEELLRQLEEQLADLEPAVAARLLTECRFRDEWRDEQCARALSQLPSNNHEHDPEVVERMQEYVALLAPDGAALELEMLSEMSNGNGGASHQQPPTWQRELLRQQRALADLLTLCAGGSPERVQGVLTDFMEHSRERLHMQLQALHEQLLINATNGGAVYNGDPAVTKVTSPNGSGVAPPAPWKANDSPRRMAWGDEGASGQQGRPKSASANKPAAEGFRGLSSDQFVEQLRGKHRAVCRIQANARGVSQRKTYKKLVMVRLGAVVRLQCCMRQGMARRALERERLRLWLDRCQRMCEEYSARRIQRAWRWRVMKRRWRESWLSLEKRRRKRQDKMFRKAVTASLKPREIEASGFSQYSDYKESKHIVARREKEDAAGVKLQRMWRAAAARSSLNAMHGSAAVIQAGVRRWKAVTRYAWWRRALRKLHQRRKSRLRWRTARATSLALQPLQTHAVLVNLNVRKELDRLVGEVQRERTSFENAFKKWSVKMEKLTLAKKLHADW